MLSFTNFLIVLFICFYTNFCQTYSRLLDEHSCASFINGGTSVHLHHFLHAVSGEGKSMHRHKIVKVESNYFPCGY